MEPDRFDEELEAEVAKVLDPGMERRRQVAVRDLHSERGMSVVARLFVVSVGISVMLMLAVWLAGLVLG